MDKRSFLKATGLTFVASLLAFGRRADDGVASVASAQENDDLAKRVAELAGRYAEIEKRCGRYETQLRLLQANDGTLEERLKGLSFSLIGTIAAISTMEIPDGWHLCDGTPIPDTDEFHDLRGIIGEPYRFPDYRGVFLRGLDEVATDGSVPTWRDPDYIERNDKNEPIGIKRKVGEEQKSANLGHNHLCATDGKHLHNVDTNNVGQIYVNQDQKVDYVKRSDRVRNPTTNRVETHDNQYSGLRSIAIEIKPLARSYPFPPDTNVKEIIEARRHECLLPNADFPHDHTLKDDDKSNHTHSILNDSDSKESRPVNISVRYIIRYA